MRTAQIMICISSAAVAFCSPRKFHSTSETKKVFDGEMLKVSRDASNLPERYRQIIYAVGLMIVSGNEGGCTVTYIGDGFALTAGHCFKAGEKLERDIPCDNLIAWGYMQDEFDSISRCERVVAAQTAHRSKSIFKRESLIDFAVIKVWPEPRSAVKIRKNSPAEIGTKITIFGYPFSRSLEWSGICQLSPAVAGSWAPSMFSHRCPTEPGNSGSVVFDDVTLEVIGIHDGGSEKDGANYATFLSEVPSWDEEVNATIVAPSSARPHKPVGHEIASEPHLFIGTCTVFCVERAT